LAVDRRSKFNASLPPKFAYVRFGGALTCDLTFFLKYVVGMF